MSKPRDSASFEVERFIADCRAALTETSPPSAIHLLVARAVSDRAPLVRALGEPTRGEVHTLHRSDDLTILNVIWAPRMILLPHDHQMWAAVGVYTGREDNIFWQRIADDPAGRIEATGAKALGDGDAVPLERDVIHSVANPIPRLTGALHVYGGDFFGTERSEWDPETLLERPYDVERNMRLFEEANAFQTGPPESRTTRPPS
jgi:predicted metal-dependent enzyme (double-stranded beta helix superfamily)